MAPKRLTANDVFMVHFASRFGVAASIAELVLALVAALLGYYWYHVSLIAGGVLVGFVASIASSYIVSGIRGKESSLMGLAKALLLVVPAAAPFTPLAGVLIGPWALGVSASVVLLAASIPAFIAASLTRGSVRASMAGIGVSSLYGAVYLAVGCLTGSVYDYIYFYTGLLYAYPVPMIYSVSIHSFPSTYREKPVLPLYAAAMAVLAAGLALTLQGMDYGFPVSAASMLLYYPAIGLHRAGRVLSKIKEARNPIVRKTHMYFLAGHFYALLATFIAILYTVLYMSDPLSPLECITHSLALGFVGLHIYIHAPLMLPVILGIPTARRYNQSPYAALLLSLLVFCINRDLALVLVAASLALLALIVWPPAKRGKY